jgi:hypothetical protein
MSLGPRLGDRALGVAPHARRQGIEHALLVDRVVPDLQVAHLGVAPHPPAIALHARRRRLGGLGLVAAHEARCDRGAGGKALEVPFPWPGMDLVEIVDSEHQVALGRGIDAEVGDMHVAARRHRQPRHGRARQIVGHDRRRAAQEGEG